MQKQNVTINFSGGIDQKTDPYQLNPGKFLVLDNVIQTKQDLLQKRPGNAPLAALPTSDYSYLTTFNGNLTAIGNNLAAYIEGQEDWVKTTGIQPCEVDTLVLARNAYNLTGASSAICEAEKLICTTYVQNALVYCVVADYETGQNVVQPFQLINPADPSQFAVAAPKVFFFANNFCIITPFNNGTTFQLSMFTIPIASINTINFTLNIDLSTFEYHSTGSFDATLAGGKIYVAWNSGSNHVKFCSIDSSFTQTNGATTFTGSFPAYYIALSADVTGSNPLLYAAWITKDGSTSFHTAYVGSFTSALAINFAAVSVPIILDGANVTVAAQNGSATLIFEITTSGAMSAIYTFNCTSAGVVSGAFDAVLSIGLASKALIINSEIYFLGTRQSTYQSTYFLMKFIAPTLNPVPGAIVIAKIAYGNGGGYVLTGLTDIDLDSVGKMYVPYLFQDLILPVNKTVTPPSSGIYTQTGVNLATFYLSTAQLTATEIGNNLNINGGFLWGYDGSQATEQNFLLWPETVSNGSPFSGPGPAAGDYYYVAIYQWVDAQGNTFQSAPSIPTKIMAPGSETIPIHVPALALTYKLTNPIQILIYRWSATQPVYYEITNAMTPFLNDPTIEFVTFNDTFLDTDILGNSILYTTGGVIEDINAPAFTAMTLFDDRLWGIDSEDQNLLWFSKQVIEATPVEMSDLFTIYIPPSTGSQGSTGVMRALAPMDDKLIIFKDNAIYYISGSGPNNTGADNGYSQPFFITGTVGCSRPRSIVPTPDGLMFQSNTGFWLLRRNLQTEYIGKDVQNYNSALALSSLNVPSSNIVKFNLDTGVTLVYNYFFGQWTTASGISPVSSVVYNNLTTFIDNTGTVYQETPGLYVDGTTPVTWSLTTAWLNVGTGLQGFQRIYEMYLLGTYYSPHKLNIGVAYDYDTTPTQNLIVTPDQFLTIERERIHMQRQECMSFQVSIEEVYDSSLGLPAGAGLTLSGLNMVVGLKKSYPLISGARSTG